MVENLWDGVPDIELPDDYASQYPTSTPGLKRQCSTSIDLPATKRLRVESSVDTIVDDGPTPTKLTPVCPPVKSVPSEDSELWNGFDDISASQLPATQLNSLKSEGVAHEKCARLDSGNPLLIAHCPAVHEIIREFPTGVKMELARLVSIGSLTYEQILSCADIDDLQGTNADAASKTAATVLEKSLVQATTDEREIQATSPWPELDTEQSILRENAYGGIGNNPSHPEYFGGKVQFRATVRISDDKSYKIELEHTQLGTSCRFTRRFGSTAFLRVKVPSNIFFGADAKLAELFTRPLVIWNTVFRTFFAKESTVFYFRTNEAYLGDISAIDTHPTMSLWDFIVWANPPETNQKQKLCKWASRFRLGLSDSVPGPLLKKENIVEIADIMSAEQSDMTDGCGLANLHLHLSFRRDFKLPSVPTAVQFRLQGGKGMLCLDSEDFQSQEAKVSLRGSQIKIRFPEGILLDPSHLTMDLLRFPRIRTPANLSPELIMNLHHNGVKDQVFIDLLHAHVEEVVTPLLKWDGHDAMYNLWNSIEQAEHVLFARRSREAAAESRINGGGDIDDDDDGDEEGLDLAVGQRSTAWWPDPVSGCPSSLAETAMSLLDSGFNPNTCPILREKIQQVAKSKVRVAATRAHFSVKQSLSAFAIPDPYNVLRADEIQIRSSKTNMLRPDGMETNVILGDVLITRNPCKVPSDVRKVKAVENHRLRDLVDVVVCSRQGHRRLLDFLGGGDYDGDRVMVIWDPAFVEQFKNADEKFSKEPEKLGTFFTINERTVGQFHEETRGQSDANKLQQLYPVLLGALRDPNVLGQYANYHSNLIYKHGYEHPMSIMMAYKFAKVMDSSKTGYELLPAVREADRKNFRNTLGPKWRKALKDAKRKRPKAEIETNETFLCRKEGLPIFIMDVLLGEAKTVSDVWLGKVEAVCKGRDVKEDAEKDRNLYDADKEVDRDLIEPYCALKKRAKETGSQLLFEDLATIRRHVTAMKQAYQAAMKGNGQGGGQEFTKQKIEVRQDKLRQLSVQFHSSPQLSDMKTLHDSLSLARIRASLAYHDDCINNPNARFSFSVAFRDLCDIKCAALGNYKTSTNSFYQRYKLMGRL